MMVNRKRGLESKQKEEIVSEEQQSVWGASEHIEDADVRLVGNHIYYYAPIMPRPIAAFVDTLHALSNKLRIQAIEFGGEVPPVELHINSFGGSISSGIAALDAVRRCPVKVNAIVDGMCASAGTFPFMVAGHRRMNKNSFMMIHQLSSGFWGSYESLKDDIKNSTEFMKLIRRVYQEHTKIPKKQLDEILKHDLWFDAEKCLKLGMTDEIV